MMHVQPIAGLDPREYEHPFDERAIESLRATPGLEAATRYFIKHAYERVLTVQCTGSNFRVTRDSYPTVHAILEHVCQTINLCTLPDLYIKWSYEINGGTVGVERPIVVLNSGAIDLLSEDELAFVIGHEVGHIKSRHTLYHEMAKVLPRIGEAMGKATLGLGELISVPLQLALLRWSRMSEFTGDRAGLLACQDFETATRVMMKTAGMPIAQYDRAKHDEFLRQAKEFDELDYDSLNRVVKFIGILQMDHPWTVLRAAELQKWVRSGDYQAVLDRKTRERVFCRHDGDVIYCRLCGFRLDGDEKFCPSCGTTLGKGLIADK